LEGPSAFIKREGEQSPFCADFVADSNGEIKIWIRLPVWGKRKGGNSFIPGGFIKFGKCWAHFNWPV
jgi:hypothetical protein